MMSIGGSLCVSGHLCSNLIECFNYEGVGFSIHTLYEKTGLSLHI